MQYMILSRVQRRLQQMFAEFIIYFYFVLHLFFV